MAVYLTAAKQAEIVKNYNFALHTSSLQTFLAEIAAAVAQAGIVEIKETIAFDDFTDNLDATGTYEMLEDIPAGALVLGATITNLTGFTGDVSADITFGDGSDVDRYNTGTPSVFTTAAAVDLAAMSGLAAHLAAKTPTIILTSNANFTAVDAGVMDVSIFYIIGD
jgi:hypothetical protein